MLVRGVVGSHRPLPTPCLHPRQGVGRAPCRAGPGSRRQSPRERWPRGLRGQARKRAAQGSTRAARGSTGPRSPVSPAEQEEHEEEQQEQHQQQRRWFRSMPAQQDCMRAGRAGARTADHGQSEALVRAALAGPSDREHVHPCRRATPPEGPRPIVIASTPSTPPALIWTGRVEQACRCHRRVPPSVCLPAGARTSSPIGVPSSCTPQPATPTHPQHVSCEPRSRRRDGLATPLLCPRAQCPRALASGAAGLDTISQYHSWPAPPR